MRKRQIFTLLVLFVTVLIPLTWLWAIDWIQSTERVVGEGSALYDDVVNRPAKQIWGIYTSQHTTTGEHKPGIFPTPLPTPTPVPLANYVANTIFEVEHNPDGTHNIATGGGLPVFHNISGDIAVPITVQYDIYYVNASGTLNFILPNYTSVADGTTVGIYLRNEAVDMQIDSPGSVMLPAIGVSTEIITDDPAVLGDFIYFRKFADTWLILEMRGTWGEDMGGS